MTPQQSFPSSFSQKQKQSWQTLQKKVSKLSENLSSFKNELNTKNQKIEEIQRLLNTAQSSLKIDKPFNIVFFGASSAGKSTLINALLGRDLLVSEKLSATTNTVITINPLSIGKKEYAFVTYYNNEEVKQIVEKMYQALFPNKKNPTNERGIDLNEVFEGLKLEKNESTKKKTLMDFMRVVAKYQHRIDNQKAEHIILDELGIKKLKNYTNENVQIGDKGGSIGSIIKKVEYYIDTSTLPIQNAVLNDVPGTGALTHLHTEHIKTRFDIEKTSAIVIVTAYEGSMGNNLRNIIDQIQKTFLQDLKPKARIEALKRIFVVANKADRIYFGGKDEESTRQTGIDGINGLVDTINPSIRREYASTNIHYEVMAMPALVSQLIAKTTSTRLELDDENIKEILGDNKPEYYQKIVAKAKEKSQKKDEKEAIIEFAGIQKLIKELNSSANKSRFEIDYKVAEDLFDSAWIKFGGLLEDIFQSVKKNNTGITAKTLKEHIISKQTKEPKIYYQKIVRNEIKELENKVEGLLDKSEKYLDTNELNREIKPIVGAILSKIEQGVKNEDFKNELIKPVYHHEQKNTSLDLSRKALIDFDRSLKGWLEDDYCDQICNTYLSKTLERILKSVELQESIENIARDSKIQYIYIQKYQQIRKDFIQELKKVYRNIVLIAFSDKDIPTEIGLILHVNNINQYLGGVLPQNKQQLKSENFNKWLNLVCRSLLSYSGATIATDIIVEIVEILNNKNNLFSESLKEVIAQTIQEVLREKYSGFTGSVEKIVHVIEGTLKKLPNNNFIDSSTQIIIEEYKNYFNRPHFIKNIENNLYKMFYYRLHRSRTKWLELLNELQDELIHKIYSPDGEFANILKMEIGENKRNSKLKYVEKLHIFLQDIKGFNYETEISSYKPSLSKNGVTSSLTLELNEKIIK